MPLYIVSTPIGNLRDISLRALDILKTVNFICAEDTRVSKKLLDYYQITTPMTSFHAYTSDEKRKTIIRRLQGGEDAALISDAGTPGISDPGSLLIRECIHENIRVIPIPGASAVLTALVASGLPTHQFLYLGFLPLKKGRKTLFQSLKKIDQTIIFYESPRRIIKTLEEIGKILNEKIPEVVIGRELTKIYEEFLRGSLISVLENLKVRPHIKGELVVLLKI